jgi:phosphoglycolate phosphatase
MDSLIFDVDGTLWDSRIPVAHAWNDSIQRHSQIKKQFDPVYLGSFFGQTMEEILSGLLPELEVEQRRALGAVMFQEENEWLEQEPGLLYPGVAETLPQLAQRYPLYLVSNCQSGYIEVMLRTTGLATWFSGHLCYGDTGNGKAENLTALCSRYGLTEPVYVGDTQGDADACAQAGIPMIFAAYGLGKVQAPWQQIDRFDQLLELV